MLGSVEIVMDVETAEVIDTLRTDNRRVEIALTERIDSVENSLTARIDGVEGSLTHKIEHVESSLTARMHELHEDAKRHSDVQIESVRDDIRMLAEGFATLSVEVRSLRR